LGNIATSNEWPMRLAERSTLYEESGQDIMISVAPTATGVRVRVSLPQALAQSPVTWISSVVALCSI